MWTRLQRAIEIETARPRRRRFALVAITAALSVAVAAVLLVSHPNQAEAALGEIANAAHQATPEEIPDGSFVYEETGATTLVIMDQSELLGLTGTVTYLLPESRQTWRQADFEQRITTVGTPSFFDPDVEAAYYAHDWDTQDQVGETTTIQLTGITDELSDIEWPTDPRELKSVLENYAHQGTLNNPLDIEVADVILELLRSTRRGPTLRAALLDVLGQLPIQLVGRGSDGSITLSITYDAPLRIQHTFTLDTSGHLIAESDTYLESAFVVPAGTTVWDATYTVPVIVDSLELPGE